MEPRASHKLNEYSITIPAAHLHFFTVLQYRLITSECQQPVLVTKGQWSPKISKGICQCHGKFPEAFFAECTAESDKSQNWRTLPVFNLIHSYKMLGKENGTCFARNCPHKQKMISTCRELKNKLRIKRACREQVGWTPREHLSITGGAESSVDSHHFMCSHVLAGQKLKAKLNLYPTGRYFHLCICNGYSENVIISNVFLDFENMM